MTWLDARRVVVTLGAMCLASCAPDRIPLDSGNSATESDGGSSTGGPVTTATSTTAGSAGATGTDSASDTDATTTSAGDATLELGWGQFGPFDPLENGGTLELMVGGQGLFMFPIPVRVTGVVLPPIPYAYDHPDAPLLDIELDAEGLEGFGGHFIYLANYPIPFEDWGDSYQFYYVALLLPDEVGGEALDPVDLDGRSAHLLGRLRPANQPTVTVEYDLVLAADVPG